MRGVVDALLAKQGEAHASHKRQGRCRAERVFLQVHLAGFPHLRRSFYRHVTQAGAGISQLDVTVRLSSRVQKAYTSPTNRGALDPLPRAPRVRAYSLLACVNQCRHTTRAN